MIKYPYDFPRAVLRFGARFAGCARFYAVIFCLLLMVSCGGGGSDPLDMLDDFLQSPDTEPIRATIRTAVPLAHIAAVAMEAVNGNVSSEVTASTTCSTYPCAGVVSMEFNQDSLPFTFDTSGSIGVAGLWTSEHSAILTVFFYDVYAGVPSFSVSEISTFPVVSNLEGGYTIVFSEIDINIDTDSEPQDLTEAERDEEYARLDDEPSDDAEVNIDMDAWVVNVSGAGSDASYSISGGGEYIGVVSSSTDSSVNVMQLGLAQVLISHVCSSNPTEGFAVINEVDVSSGDSGSLPVVASALMEFDPSCDGRVDVVVATGNYVASNGGSVPIDLNE